MSIFRTRLLLLLSVNLLSAVSAYYYFASAAVAVDSSHRGLRLRYHPLRGVDSIRLQIWLMGTYRQCGSWSVAGHYHRKVIRRDRICAS